MQKKVFIFAFLFLGLLVALNKLSYGVRKQRWDLNICSGKTGDGGINAGIAVYTTVTNLVLVDAYRLPFRAGQFPAVLSSHTVERVDDPVAFYAELRRVGRDVTLVIPPLWDLSAALNVLERRWIFLSLRKRHTTLPLARTLRCRPAPAGAARRACTPEEPPCLIGCPHRPAPRSRPLKPSACSLLSAVFIHYNSHQGGK